MFRNLAIYRIAAGWQAPSIADLEAELQRLAFSPCGPTQEQSFGWVPPRNQDHGDMVVSTAGHILLKVAVERRAVPGPAVREAVEARCKAIEDERGRKPGRKERAEIKDEVVLSLMPRAFSKRLSHLVWIDTERRTVTVDAASHRAAEPVIKQLVDVMADMRRVMPLAPLAPVVTPTSAMAEWLTTRQAPEGFTIDRTLELKHAGEDRSVVRYSRHSLDLEEIGQHIQEGKLPTQLALTWDDKVSFVLTNALCIKRVELRGLMEAPKGEDGFDADVAISTADIGAMIPALVEAMGGEVAQ